MRTKVLTADDSRIIRKIIRGAVEEAGLELLEAGNGQEALDILEDQYPDIAVVLLDWNMPVVDGYAVLQRVKGDKRFEHIQVMMVTTETERENVLKAIVAGADNYITKPFAQEDLAAKILEVLGKGL